MSSSSMQSLGKLPADLCLQYERLLSRHGIRCQVIDLDFFASSDLSAGPPHGEVLVPSDEHESALDLIRKYEAGAKDRVETIIQTELREDIYHAFFLLMAFALLAGGVAELPESRGVFFIVVGLGLLLGFFLRMRGRWRARRTID